MRLNFGKGKVTSLNLKRIVSVHYTNLLRVGSVTIMRASYFDVDLASQIKLPELPLIGGTRLVLGEVTFY